MYADSELVLIDLCDWFGSVNESARLMSHGASPAGKEVRDFLAIFWPQIHTAHGYDELYLLVTNKFLADTCVSCVNEFFANPSSTTAHGYRGGQPSTAELNLLTSS